MKYSNHNNWSISIQNAELTVSNAHSSSVIDTIYESYGAHSFDDLPSCSYSDVLADLEMIERDN